MEILGNNFGAKRAEKGQYDYYCENCDFKCYKKYNWDRHITTTKHLIGCEKGHKSQNCINHDVKCSNQYNYNVDISKTYYGQEIFGNRLRAKGQKKELCIKCEYCQQKYKTNSGLWKHIKKCIHPNKTKTNINVIDGDNKLQDFIMEQNKQLIDQLSQQNKTLMEQNHKLFEIVQTSNGVNHQIGTINNVNTNKFNINVFLNETCKDALNLTDFVNQITLSLEDLEETSKLGYVEGISNVFIRNLNEIDYKERPIHCNDYKREIIYIKDDNQWVKNNKEKLTNAIKIVSNKNIKQIPNWQKANPEYNNPKSKQNDKYMKMLYEVMSGSSKEEQQKNYDKIIKNISKKVLIDKDSSFV